MILLLSLQYSLLGLIFFFFFFAKMQMLDINLFSSHELKALILLSYFNT